MDPPHPSKPVQAPQWACVDNNIDDRENRFVYGYVARNKKANFATIIDCLIVYLCKQHLGQLQTVLHFLVSNDIDCKQDSIGHRVVHMHYFGIGKGVSQWYY